MTLLAGGQGLDDANCISSEQLSTFAKQDLSPIFNDQQLKFVATLSQCLLKNKAYKVFPELVALGFWLRETNLHKKIQAVGLADKLKKHDLKAKDLKAKDLKTQDTQTKPIGLGFVAHFTPANVDTMFVYSWVASLLMGNTNLVRVASQDSESKKQLLKLIQQLCSQVEFAQIARQNIFVSYDKSTNWTAQISALADARMIWGGDASVSAITDFVTKPNCKDFSFADKHSVAITTFNNITEHAPQAAQNIWRDTQAFYQQACSSPRVLYLIKPADISTQQCSQSLHKLFLELNSLAKSDYDNWLDDTRVNEHLLTLQSLSINDKEKLNPQLIQLDTITALSLDTLNQASMEMHKGNGIFYVRVCESNDALMQELQAVIGQKLQTISVSKDCIDNIKSQAKLHLTHHSYRIQEAGQALDFSFSWDGYNLLAGLSQL